MEEKYKLNRIKNYINNYLNEKVIDEINPKYYKEWMLNVRKKIISEIDEDKK